MINGKSKIELAKIYMNITTVRKNKSHKLFQKTHFFKKKQLHNVAAFEFAILFFLTNRCRSCLLYEKLDSLIEISDQT